MKNRKYLIVIAPVVVAFAIGNAASAKTNALMKHAALYGIELGSPLTIQECLAGLSPVWLTPA